MPAYVCVTHALSRREETDAFCRGLSRYGFRFACIHEQTDPQHREETLTEASLLIALTCPAAEEAETVAADIRRAMTRGVPVLCVSMKENGLDHRFCSPEGGAYLIPAPAADTPDRRPVSLFIHRLFIRHLARLPECFSLVRCVEDAYGTVVAAAVAFVEAAAWDGWVMMTTPRDTARFFAALLAGEVAAPGFVVGEVECVGLGAHLEDDGVDAGPLQGVELGGQRGLHLCSRHPDELSVDGLYPRAAKLALQGLSGFYAVDA